MGNESTSPDTALIEKNLLLYGETFLEWFTKFTDSDHKEELEKISELKENTKTFFPLYHAKMGQDVEWVAFCSDDTTYIWALKPTGEEKPLRVVTKFGDDQFDRHWSRYQNPAKKKEEILAEIGKKSDDELFSFDYSGSQFLKDNNTNGITETAKSAAHSSCGGMGPFGVWMSLDFLEEEAKNKTVHDSISGKFSKVVSGKILDHAARGRLFQEIISQKLTSEGAIPKNIKTRSDEIDQIVVLDGERVLIECRYTDGAIEAKEIRDFLGKLKDRPPFVIGIFIAATNFSKGAIETADRSINERAIVLIEVSEIADILSQPYKTNGNESLKKYILKRIQKMVESKISR